MPVLTDRELRHLNVTSADRVDLLNACGHWRSRDEARISPRVGQEVVELQSKTFDEHFPSLIVQTIIV